MSFNRTIITYVDDSVKFLKELSARFPDKIGTTEDGEPFFNIAKTRTIRKNNITLSALLLQSPKDYEILESLHSIKILGPYEEIFLKPEANRLYKKVWDYEKTNYVIDENGRKVEYKLSKKFCVFA